MKGRKFQCLRDPGRCLEGRSQTPGGHVCTSVDSSPRGVGRNQEEEEEVVRVSELWNQGRGPGHPGSGVGLRIPTTDPAYLTYATLSPRGFADVLFLEMFLP